MNKGRMIGVALVWIVIIAIGAMTYKWIFVPRAEKEQQQVAEQKRKDVIAGTSSDSRYKYEVSFAIDSFSGYAVFRSDEFKNECASRGVKVNLVDDAADYPKRLKALQSGEAQMGVFTIDALIKSSAGLGDTPAVIVSLVDETKGADAMVGSKVLVPSIDALNDPNTKFVVTPDSPSESLARVVMAYFNLDRLGVDPWIKVDGAKKVYEEYKASKPTDKKVFVLWEPYVSKMTENSDYRVVIDSSKFKGYIVDVMVVSRDFLVKNEEVVRAVVESYFRANFAVRHRMVELVQDDSQITGEKFKADQAKKVAGGIQWKNTQENYAHFGMAGGTGYQHIDDMITNITAVLRKTNGIGGDPAKGKPNLLYYDKILRHMFDNGFHPGFGSEEVRQENKLAALTDDEWKSLRPVGTLQVPRLVFARGTAKLTDASEETLASLAKNLKTWPQYYLVVRGNCSKEGDVEANRKLAADRSKSAMDWLIQNGVDKNRIRADTSEPNGSMTVAFILGQMAY
jgi:flagellar motor protein MotB